MCWSSKTNTVQSIWATPSQIALLYCAVQQDGNRSITCAHDACRHQMFAVAGRSTLHSLMFLYATTVLIRGRRRHQRHAKNNKRTPLQARLFVSSRLSKPSGVCWGVRYHQANCFLCVNRSLLDTPTAGCCHLAESRLCGNVLHADVI